MTPKNYFIFKKILWIILYFLPYIEKIIAWIPRKLLFHLKNDILNSFPEKGYVFTNDKFTKLAHLFVQVRMPSIQVLGKMTKLLRSTDRMCRGRVQTAWQGSSG